MTLYQSMGIQHSEKFHELSIKLTLILPTGIANIAHWHYDPSMAKEDFNTIFPLKRLLELEAERVVGKIAQINYSLSYVNDVDILVSKTIPKLLEHIKAQGIDILFLVPV